MSKDGEDDNQLWKQATRDVKKLGGKMRAAPETPAKRIKLKERRAETITLPLIEIPGGGIDRKTEAKIRKGEIEIEATLDLHGLTVDRARSSLFQFVAQCFSSGNRCVLVITGKGAGKGVIKREFPLWLEDPSVRACILSSAPAQPKHGGSGASYIYLRKNKTLS